ncbi:MAG: radical SAM protein [Candidatus Hinthialibacter antarcticus]|nr:radical SAM protein [Candidatus Hinthialibacter antarcticus]
MNAWKKAYLAVPPTGKYIREDRCQTPLDELHTVALRPPIDLLYVAGALEKAGVECLVQDYPAKDLNWDSFRRNLQEFQPDALILSITTPTLADDVKAAAIAKEINPNIITICKGAHFKHLDHEAMKLYPQIDIVVRGEYEETLGDLSSGKPWHEVAGITHRTTEGPVRNAERAFIQDIDDISFPARHLIDNSIYIRPDTEELQTTIVTSRGCPFSCIYCLAPKVSGNKVRTRSPQNVLAEIKECVEKHGIRNFLFRSDLFTAKKTWVKELCQAIQAEKLDIKWSCNSRIDTLEEDMLVEMRKSGCWLIAFGVEHGDPEMLELMRKQLDYDKIEPAIQLCKKVGIKTSVYFLIGLPWESRSTFEKTKAFARQLDPDFVEFFYTYPFYGTEFYEIAVKEGLLEEGTLPHAAYNSPAIATKHLTLDELKPLRKEALRSFYLRPGYIFRTLTSNPSPTVFKNYMIYGLRQLKDLVA